MGIDEQINCLKKEYRRRERFYPGLVAEGKLPADYAEAEIARMKAAMETLAQLKGMLK